MESDLPALLEMIRELAEFENLSHQVTADEEDFRQALFGGRPAAEALICDHGGDPAGYAIFFSTFSTFLGKAGIWLEDVYVRPSFRRQGLGTSLLREVAAIARERGAGRLEWCVLDWNRNAIDLYEKIGGEILDEWRIVRLESQGIATLATTQ